MRVREAVMTSQISAASIHKQTKKHPNRMT